MIKFIKNKIWIFLLLFNVANADVVKPVLIEIIANTDGKVTIEIRASIEAMLTGIDGRYKNTKESPRSLEYDELRNLAPSDLSDKFNAFQAQFLSAIQLLVDDKIIKLSVLNTNIPEVGYPKIPRISLITLTANIPKNSQKLSWFYPKSFGNNAVRVKQVDLKNEKWHWSNWQWLRNNKPSDDFMLSDLFKPLSSFEQVSTYLTLGISHIVPKGLDHMLFILGIFLLTLKIRPLLLQVSIFTVAHMLTLGLAINGIIELSPKIVQPLVALSIAYIGVENIFLKQVKLHRLVLIFGFGLLHGLGFAGALLDFGLPKKDFLLALLSFNVGVEIAQIFLIFTAFVFTYFLRKHHTWNQTHLGLSGLIAIIGIYWFFDRLLII